MISIDAKNKIFTLNTKGTTYIMAVADDMYLSHVYYGRKLNHTDVSALISHLRMDAYPFCPSKNMRDKVRFMEELPMEYSFAGTGDYREACIDVENADGELGLELFYDSYEVYEGKKELDGLPYVRGEKSDCDTLEVTLKDPLLDLYVVLSYTVYRDIDAITRSVRVVNKSDKRIYLKRVLSACLDQDCEESSVLTLHGCWTRERKIQILPLGTGSRCAESIRGESSAEDNPFMALMKPGADQTSGEVYGMNLVYSGNFLAKAQNNQYDKVRMVMGIHPMHFTWCLECGDSFQAPEAVLVYSDSGLEGMTHTYHKLYREHLIPKKWAHADRPVLVNNWEATFMDFNTDILLEFAGEAQKLGLDMLVMDDGWFGARNDDNAGLGDWYVNEKKLPGGLKRLCKGVNDLGLKFGIWIEPEMVNEDSDLYRAHPDWVFRRKGKDAQNLWRQQCVLDLTREEVWNYVYDQIKESFQTANIAYVKWDMNRPLSEVANAVTEPRKQGELYHRYVLALYRMQAQLLSDFPDILLENCSSGGCRFDPGMLFYSPQIWTSDDTDAIERLSIQEGTSLIYPMSTMGAHVSVCPNQQTGRNTPFETRANVAMAGTFGYELDIRKLSDEDRKLIPEQIKRFREVNPVVRDGQYFRLASYRENHLYDCWENVSPDQKQAVVTYVQVLSEPNKRARRIRLRGLDPDMVYNVDGVQIHGDTLMNAGLIMPRFNEDYKSVQILISAE